VQNFTCTYIHVHVQADAVNSIDQGWIALINLILCHLLCTVLSPHNFFYTIGDTTTENDSDLSVDTLSK